MPGPLPHSQPCSVRSPALRNHTRCKPALTLGSPASGIREPIPKPPRACTGVGGQAAAAAPPPPALDSAQGNPEGKGRGGGSRRLETPTPGGFPPAPQICALSPPPTLGDRDGGGSCEADPGQGRERAGAEAPTLGEESWAAAGGGGSGRAGAAWRGGARSPARPPAGAPGWAAAARRGLGSARGSRRWAQA